MTTEAISELNQTKLLEKGSNDTEQLSLAQGSIEGWSVVEKSRHPKRPYALDYVHFMFSDFEEFKGDRRFGEDPAIVAGVGVLKGKLKKKMFFIANQKGRTTKEKVERNFGMAKPEGYRKVLRTVELAERFNKPILSFIDTPGAYPGMDAEERGQSEAIASSIQRLFKATVPSIGVVIGEGGSGGALALGMTDRLMMLQNATYSVISPESCAAILWGYAGEAKQAAFALKLAAKNVLQFGLCDEIIEESGNGAHESFDQVAEKILERLLFHLKSLEKISPKERMDARFERYRRIDGLFLMDKSLKKPF